MTRDGRLPDPLARPDDPDRRQLERLEHGNVEAEVGPDVRHPVGQGKAREPEALARAEHRLVGEVDDRLRLELADRGFQVVHERNAVVLAAAQLLRPADEERADEVVRQLGQGVAHDVGVVLAVDQGDRARHRVVTSPSIRAVYFSNASVSVENWMIFSCPWNGYLRQTSTCGPRHLDEVVTGPRVPPEAQRRDGPRVDDEEILEAPRVRHVLVTRQDEVDSRALQALDRVPGVVHDVPLAAGSGTGSR